MKILYEVYEINWKTVLVPSSGYYRKADNWDEDSMYELKFVEQFDTEDDAIEFVTNIDTKNCTYTILKTYSK